MTNSANKFLKSTGRKPKSTATLGLLPTPKAQDKMGVSSSGYPSLEKFVSLLPTLRAGNPGSRPNKKGGKILAEEIALLGTPRGTQAKRSSAFRKGRTPSPE